MAPRGSVLAVTAALLVLAGCGSSPTDQVRSTLEGYAKAFGKHDYQALCDRYFAPQITEALKQSGLPCEAAVRVKVSTTVHPVLKVGAVQVQGDRATAQIHTTAQGEQPSDDTLALVKTHGRWQISSLADQGPQPVGP